jgi:hypothetical protein
LITGIIHLKTASNDEAAPPFTGKEKLRMINKFTYRFFGVNYAIVLLKVILAFVSMFKPEISALKEH